MDRKHKIAMLVMTVAVAGLTGHVMQRVAGDDHPANRLQAGAPYTQSEPTTAEAPTTAPATTPMRSADLPAADDLVPPAAVQPPQGPDVIAEAVAEISPGAALTETPALLDPPELMLSALPDAAPEALSDPSPPLPMMALTRVNGEVIEHDVSEPAPVTAEQDDPCAPVLVLAAAPGAMIDLALDVPCNPEARVLLRHEGLAITAHTSATGALDLSLPAMAAQASVTLSVRGGPNAAASIEIPDLDGFERVAVQWQGADAFLLNAYEFGAGYGDEGHVSARAPGTLEEALDGAGGFLLRLGDGQGDWPLMAEVYSFPVAAARREGAVRFDVEAAITQRTCGHDMLGEALYMQPGAPTEVIEITLAMPGCDTPDGFLVLNNLLPDMKIAQN